MKLTITLNTDNAAFEGDNGNEIARILNELADNLTTREVPVGESGNLRDFNGNKVGTYSMES